MTEYNPRLVAPTCLYLAAKAEESTVQARLLIFYIKKIPSIYIFVYIIPFPFGYFLCLHDNLIEQPFCFCRS